MKKRKVKIDQKCQECDVDCQCGCQSNIYSLPFEVMERVLWYQDPLTLAALERTSKFFFAIVSDFWVLYCKRNHIGKRPTPLCSDWRSKNGDSYCYERALQQVNDDTQRWRIMAIRVYLRHNCQCVVCMSFCDDKEQYFLYRDDVLLCHHCLPHFSITITHNLLHILNSIGVSNSQLHFNFGTILLCQFIKALKSNIQAGDDILEKVQSFLAQQTQTRSGGTGLLPLSEGINSAPIQQRSLPNLNNIYYSNSRKCCCSVQQCSSSSRFTARIERPRNLTRQRPFIIALGILSVINVFVLIHCAVLMDYFRMINIIKMTVANFIMLSFIDIALLVCLSAYLIITSWKRKGKREWNRSFGTILQCFLLACAIVEIAQSTLARSYFNDYEAASTSFIKSGIANYNESKEIRSKIDWIQREFSCCGYSANATDDWLMLSGVFPWSCCQLNYWNCTETRRYKEDCVARMKTTVQPILTSFIWTSLLFGIFHISFIIYVCVLFNFLNSSSSLGRIYAT